MTSGHRVGNYGQNEWRMECEPAGTGSCFLLISYFYFLPFWYVIIFNYSRCLSVLIMIVQVPRDNVALQFFGIIKSVFFKASQIHNPFYPASTKGSKLKNYFGQRVLTPLPIEDMSKLFCVLIPSPQCPKFHSFFFECFPCLNTILGRKHRPHMLVLH